MDAVGDNLLRVDWNRSIELTVCRSSLVYRCLVAGYAPLVCEEYIFSATNMEFLKGRLDRATLQRLVDLLPGMQEAAQPLGGCGQVLCGLFLVVGWIILCVSWAGRLSKLLAPAAGAGICRGRYPSTLPYGRCSCCTQLQGLYQLSLGLAAAHLYAQAG